ncbi:nSTAND1 domain-containing NTPase [Niabella terrae]
MEKMYRYPGVRPFTTEEQGIFFGREQDAQKLYDLLMLEELVVLFAKSGRGKSSLINAALIPMLEKTTGQDRFSYTPVEVRLSDIRGSQVSPIDKIIARLNEVAPVPAHSHPVLDMFAYRFRLWHHFKKIQLTQPRRVILIFDQFEEFFHLSLAQQQEFKSEISELLYSPVPQIVREHIDELTHEQYDMLAQPMDIHILFSIRSDHLSSMHSMTDLLPNLLKNRFEIYSLSLPEAREAILRPAAIQDPDTFITHAFTYDNEALEAILSQFTGREQDEGGGIEPFHLQIICQACEVRIEEKLRQGIPDFEVNPADLPAFDDLYGDYYRRQLGKLPEGLRLKAGLLLEDHLIHEIGRTGEYRRIPVDKDVLISDMSRLGASPELLDRLEEVFLIRREPNTVGGYSYEIAHDTILDPIVKQKKLRLQAVREAELQQLKLSKQKIERERRLGRITLAFLTSIIIALICIFYWDNFYFSYKMMTSNDQYPVIKDREKLQLAADILENDVYNTAAKIGFTDINTWEAAQLMMALYRDSAFDGNHRLRGQYLGLAQRTLKTKSCSWNEIRHFDDIRASSWIISANGMLGLNHAFSCNPVNFLLDHQDSSGAWPMYVLPATVKNYNATYATCHVLRALNNALPSIPDSLQKVRTRLAIEGGVQWLLTSISDFKKARWGDYDQKQGRYESLPVSMSISGLAIHTLNILGSSTDTLNQHWLKSLLLSDAAMDINLRERSDKSFLDDNLDVILKDETRHLILPWMLIATVDAYSSGTFSERLRANKWINRVIENLDPGLLPQTDRFARAEVLISLRYLMKDNYTFK